MITQFHLNWLFNFTNFIALGLWINRKRVSWIEKLMYKNEGLKRLNNSITYENGNKKWQTTNENENDKWEYSYELRKNDFFNDLWS